MLIALHPSQNDQAATLLLMPLQTHISWGYQAEQELAKPQPSVF